MHRLAALIALALAALLLIACGDGSSPSPSPTLSPTPAVVRPSPTPAPTPSPTPTPQPQTAVITEPGIYIVRPDGGGLRGPTNGFPFGWSPDGTRIAVVTDMCERVVAIVIADSGSAEEIASFPGLSGFISEFEWAPDSQRLLLGITEPPAEGPQKVATTHVFVVNASGHGEPMEIFRGRFFAWAPDGSKIAYEETIGMAGQLKVLNLSDGNTINLAFDAASSTPAWSPDGTRLAFSTDHLPPELIVVNADGSNPIVVASGGSGPVWMPDGQRIVFSRFEEQVDSSVAIVPADGGSIETLRTGFGFDISRDGRIIVVYDNLQDGRTEIEAFRDSESLGIVSGDLMPVGDVVALSPDGSQLIFNAQDETTGRRDLYLVNVEGTGLRTLVQPSVDIGSGADWSADGRNIAFFDTKITGFFC